MSKVLERIEEEMREEDRRKVLLEIRVLLSETKTRKNGTYRLALFCLEVYVVITIKESDEMYIYNEGTYGSYGEKIISEFVQKKTDLGNLITNNLISELIGFIRRMTYRKIDDVKEPQNKICLQNGVLNLDTLSLEQHSPKDIFFNKIPVKYDPLVTCPEIENFISQVVSQENQELLFEIIGFCLYKRYFIHKAIMLVGSGANGKSTYLNLVRTFLGEKNVSSIPLHQLETQRFSISVLHGKLANTFADLDSKALTGSSTFKMLCGEDLVPAERKFRDHFFFTNYAKLLFSCNQIPRSADDSDAFFRRWVIVVFPNQFLSNPDKRLLKRLTTEDELSGLLNRSIESLKNLLQKGDFTNSLSVEKVREDYIRKSDSVGAFAMDKVLVDPDASIPKKELYTNYCEYCRKEAYPIVAENTFHRQLQANVRVEDYRPLMSVDGKNLRVACWKGIKIGKKEVQNNPDMPDNADHNVKDVRVVNDSSDSIESDFSITSQFIAQIVKEKGSLGYSKELAIEKYGVVIINETLERGLIFELPAGILRAT